MNRDPREIAKELEAAKREFQDAVDHANYMRMRCMRLENEYHETMARLWPSSSASVSP